MDRPLVSIVVPMYNVRKYIIGCLDSLRRQTYKNIEVLVIDDCGQDGSLELAIEYAKKDSRFRIICHDQNRGPGGARNTGIESATGDYLAFLDSDDSFSRDAIELLVKKSAQTTADMVLANMAVNKNGILFPEEYINTMIIKMLQSGHANVRDIDAGAFCSSSAVHRVYRAEFLRENDISFLEKTHWEDVPFSAEVWYHAKRIHVIPNFIYYRTIREDENNPSITQNKSRKSFEDRDIILDYLFQLSQRRPDDKEHLTIMNTLIRRMIYTTRKMMQTHSRDEDQSFLREWLALHEQKFELYQGEMAEALKNA